MAKKKHQWDIHHRKPQNHGGNDSHSNTVQVNKHQHAAFHRFFACSANGTMYPSQMVNLLNKWIDPEYKLVCLSPSEYEEVTLWLAKRDILNV